jgi:hypothetical protein
MKAGPLKAGPVKATADTGLCTQSGFWATSTTTEIRGLCDKCARPGS